MSALLKQYEGRSQADIHEAVCALTTRILNRRNATGYIAQVELQHLRRQRSELQSLLRKPVLVWSAP